MSVARQTWRNLATVSGVFTFIVLARPSVAALFEAKKIEAQYGP